MRKIGHSIGLAWGLFRYHQNAELLVHFSYHLQIHDWGWISFYLKVENAWDIILELTKVAFF